MKTKLIAIFFLVQITMFAQKAQKEYLTTKISAGDIQIDGNLTESTWEKVEWGTDFLQRRPKEGEKPTYQTKFKVLYDDNFIYVGIYSLDMYPDSIIERMSRRDGFEGDRVEIMFDSHYDKQTAFSFTASVSGVRGDEYISNDEDLDDSWDPLWEVKTSIKSDGWVAELKIPFTQLRFDAKEEQIWGMQVIRHLDRSGERSHWRYISKKDGGFVRNFGILKGIKNIKPKKQIEISPYLVGFWNNYKKENGNPFKDGNDIGGNVGLDGKLGITNDLILDFTINPDFRQVEADPSEVNLSGFESYFSEKRPFFMEGNDLIDLGFEMRNNLFYSRRIGKAPSFYPSIGGNEFMKRPNNTRILGAVKLNGKTKNGVSFGIMESITAREYAKISDGKNERKEMVEPLTSYFVASARKSWKDNNSVLKILGTSTNRQINDDNLRFIPKNAYSAGMDYKYQWKEKLYFFQIKLGVSQINGDNQAISNLYNSSRRYFNRPDNDYVSFDPMATHMRGDLGSFTIGKQGRSGWRYSAFLTWISPKFDANDIGFSRKSDELSQAFWVGYSMPKQKGIFRNFNININQWTAWDYGGNKSFHGENVNIYMNFINLWNGGGGVSINGGDISNSKLRGGPSLQASDKYYTWIWLGTNRKKKFSTNISINYHSSPDKTTKGKSFGINFHYRPTNALRFSFLPDISFSHDKLAYLTSLVSFIGGDNYLLATLDQVTTDFTLRADWIITPDLTLQYYGSPFIFAADYSDAKFVVNPHADYYEDRFDTDISKLGLDADYADDFDFNFKEFQSNLLLRWEYRPGSLIYLVWTQSRNDFEDMGIFNVHNNLNALFNEHGNNVVLLKWSYRFF